MCGRDGIQTHLSDSNVYLLPALYPLLYPGTYENRTGSMVEGELDMY